MAKHIMATILLIVCSACARVIASSFAASPEELISRWVEQLGHDSFAERKAAMQNLLSASDAAIPILTQALAQQDYESQRRSLLVLEDFAAQRGQAVEDKIVEQLTALQATASADTVRLMQQSLQAITERRTILATEELTSLGAELREGELFTALGFGRSWKGSVEKIGLARHLPKVAWVSIEHSNLTDSCLPQLAKIKGLKKLYLGDSHVRGQGLECFVQLTQLDYLSLKNLELDESAFTQIAELKALQSLGLDGTSISDAQLAQLATLPNLKTLWLDHTSISEQSLIRLAELKNLTSLHLAYTKISGAGLASLKDCPHLNLLSLKGVQLTPEDLGRLSGMTSLQSLGLDHTNVTDAHVERLRELPALRVLWLTKTNVTDDCIEDLVHLPALETVYLHASNVTEHGAAKLKKLLPNCKVYR